MIEFPPHIPILIGWDPAKPGDRMMLDHARHASGQRCEKGGGVFVAERAATFSAPGDKGYRHLCAPTPSGKTHDRAFEQRP